MFSIPYFSKRAAAKEAIRQAEIIKMASSPTIELGPYLLVNPLYRGPNPYTGPEVRDPKNKGRDFIVIRAENAKLYRLAQASKKGSQ